MIGRPVVIRWQVRSGEGNRWNGALIRCLDFVRVLRIGQVLARAVAALVVGRRCKQVLSAAMA
ncbi:MAG: hypothetical protein CBB71_04270 [Rhodopirellula sp. TMED11]|nr:MAG: hypothetical protein CBB71_04270 [Rhodopirellula sp. TMED11]